MASLPVLSGREVAQTFSKDGWRMARQKGSHMVLIKDAREEG